MYLNYLILIFLLSSEVISKEIVIKHRLFQYKIIVFDTIIRYEAPYTNLSIEKKECTDILFKQLVAETKLQDFEKYSNFYSENSIEIKYEGESRYFSKQHENYKFFSSFDSHFKTLKIEEKISCTP